MPNAGQSFASGFTRGLANAMATKRAEATRRKEREQEIRLKGLDALFREGYIQPGDMETVIGTIFGDEPGKKPQKAKAGQPDPRAIVSNILGTALKNDQAQKSGGMPPWGGAAVSPADVAVSKGAAPLPQAPQERPKLPMGLVPPGGVPEAPQEASGGSFMGAALLSPDQVASNEANRKVRAQEVLIQRQIKVARESVLPALRALDPKATIWDALDAVGVDMSRLRSTGATMPRFAGNVEGNQLPAGTLDVNGDPIKPEWRYRTNVNPDGSFSYLPTEARMINAGTGYLQAAIALGYGSVDEAIDAGKTTELRAKAEEIRKSAAKAQAAGTAEARFEAPIDIPTSQSSGLPVGTSATQVEGQTIPTMEQQAAIRTGTVLQMDLQRLLGDATNPSLLSVLPSKNSLGGLAPGAALALRRRSNAYREALASLESVVNSMVNDLARYRGQRGAQTEGDVNRAYDALVQLQAGLTDPFGGDTQESARARILEAKAGLDRVAAAMPKQPVPRPSERESAPPQTAAPVAGAVMRDGKLYIDGVEIGAPY